MNLTLGDSSLDEDHARFQELVHVLLGAGPNASLDALEALHSHAERHFDEEDRDLRLMKDGNASCHIKEHAEVLASLSGVRAVLVDDKVALDAKEQLFRRLAIELLSWLPAHVTEMDAGIAAYRSARRFGGAQVRIVRARVT